MSYMLRIRAVFAHRAAGLPSVALGLLLLADTRPATAQSLVAHESSASVHPGPAAVRRIAAGERSLYELRLGGRSVGSGSLEVLAEEHVNGHPTMHAALQVSGGIWLAKVNDRFDSWIDPVSLFSRRFVQDQHELTSTRHRDYAMSPEQRTFTQADNGQQSALNTDQPLDDISFLFFARTLRLQVGDVDTIPRYFKPGHDVILKVLRKERVTVPAGTFETVVVQPTITHLGGLFGQGGEAEVYFSDDAARTIVQIRSKVPLVGSLSLHLTEFRAGKP